MSVSINELRELSEKFKCGIDCSACVFLKECKSLDEEKLKYRPQLIYIFQKAEDNKDIPIDSSDYVVLPKLKIASENVWRKLYDLLITIIQLNQYDHTCNAKTLAESLNISILKIRKRLNYLRTKNIMSFKYTKNCIFLEFIDNTTETTLKFKTLLTAYSEFFKDKFNNVPFLDHIDYITIKRFVKKTAYSPEQLKLLIKEYFSVNNLFIRNTGYKLRNFPTTLNSILISRPDFAKLNDNNKTISDEQLINYIKGKTAGKWTGAESWAEIYENQLKKMTKDELVQLEAAV